MLDDAVTYSDHLLLYYLREHARKPLTISHGDLSLRLGIPERTVRRAMLRLERAKLITRNKSYGRVYTYEVLYDDHNQSA